MRGTPQQFNNSTTQPTNNPTPNIFFFSFPKEFYFCSHFELGANEGVIRLEGFARLKMAFKHSLIEFVSQLLKIYAYQTVSI